MFCDGEKRKVSIGFVLDCTLLTPSLPCFEICLHLKKKKLFWHSLMEPDCQSRVLISLSSNIHRWHIVSIMSINSLFYLIKTTQLFSCVAW
jgi:hypothetical protein